VTSRRWVQTLGPLLGLLFVAIIFGATIGPRFFYGANLELIARQTAIVCTAALGMTKHPTADSTPLTRQMRSCPRTTPESPRSSNETHEYPPGDATRCPASELL